MMNSSPTESAAHEKPPVTAEEFRTAFKQWQRAPLDVDLWDFFADYINNRA
jgi:hypothetical protein